MSHASSTRGFIQPSFLGNFVKFNNCHRYYKIDRADDVNSLLHHDKDEYFEAFRGGSIVERQAGNEFEKQLLDTFAVHTTDVYDLSTPTLATVAELVPQAVKNEYDLIDTGIETIKDGDFNVDGKPAANHTLGQSDNTHIKLRSAYTKAFILRVLENPSTQPVDVGDINGPVNIATPGNNQTQNRQPDEPIIIYQPTFRGKIGAWDTGGDGDFLFIWPEQNDIYVRIIDAKLATEEKPHHQVQTAVYAKLFEDTIPDTAYTTINAGIITPDPDTHLPLNRRTLPSFNLTDRYTDVNQLMRPGGSLVKAQTGSFDDAPYQLDQKCSGCSYNEACYVDTVESEKPELLGLGQSSQQKLRKPNINITSLADLAKVLDPVRTSTAKNRFDKIKPRDNLLDSASKKYHLVTSLPGLGERITNLIQDTQSILGVFYPSESYTYAYNDMHQYTNAPPSTLPDVFFSEDVTEQGFIRVYLNVQDDHVQDSISGVAALVTHIESETETPVTSLQTDVTLDRNQAKDNEKQLLSTFATDLLDAIQATAEQIDLSDEPQDHPIVHFYTYTEHEKRLLQQALATHTTPYVNHASKPTGQSTITNTGTTRGHTSTDNRSVHPLTALRDLIGHVRGADQHMVSAVLPEINARMAKKTPTLGILNTWQYFTPDNAFSRLQRSSFGEYTPQDTSRLPSGVSTLDVTDGLSYKLFNNSIPYTVGPDGITLHPKGSPTNDGWYPMRVRTAAQIPLGYIWAAVGRIDDDWVQSLERQPDKGTSNIYRYYDRNVRDIPIVVEDIEETMLVMTRMLRHIEQGIPDKTKVTIPSED